MSDERIAELEAENEWLRQELDRFRGPLMDEVYRNLADVESRLVEAQAAAGAFAAACHIIAEQGGRLPAIRALEAHPGWL